MFLMQFWSKIVSSISTTSSARPKQHDRIEILSSEITKAFIQCRLDYVDHASTEGNDGGFFLFFDQIFPGDNAFEEENTEIVSIFELLAFLSRLKYDENCSVLIQKFDSLASAYEVFLL